MFRPSALCRRRPARTRPLRRRQRQQQQRPALPLPLGRCQQQRRRQLRRQQQWGTPAGCPTSRRHRCLPTSPPPWPPPPRQQRKPQRRRRRQRLTPPASSGSSPAQSGNRGRPRPPASHQLQPAVVQGPSPCQLAHQRRLTSCWASPEVRLPRCRLLCPRRWQPPCGRTCSQASPRRRPPLQHPGRRQRQQRRSSRSQLQQRRRQGRQRQQPRPRRGRRSCLMSALGTTISRTTRLSSPGLLRTSHSPGMRRRSGRWSSPCCYSPSPTSP